MNSARAITLVEVLVSVALLAVVVATVAPWLRGEPASPATSPRDTTRLSLAAEAALGPGGTLRTQLLRNTAETITLRDAESNDITVIAEPIADGEHLRLIFLSGDASIVRWVRDPKGARP